MYHQRFGWPDRCAPPNFLVPVARKNAGQARWVLSLFTNHNIWAGGVMDLLLPVVFGIFVAAVVFGLGSYLLRSRQDLL